MTLSYLFVLILKSLPRTAFIFGKICGGAVSGSRACGNVLPRDGAGLRQAERGLRAFDRP